MVAGQAGWLYFSFSVLQFWWNILSAVLNWSADATAWHREQQTSGQWSSTQWPLALLAVVIFVDRLTVWLWQLSMMCNVVFKKIKNKTHYLGCLVLKMILIYHVFQNCIYLYNMTVYRAILRISCSRWSVLLWSAWAADGLASPWKPSVSLLLCFLKKIQDELLAINTYRKDKPKLGLNNFKALLNLS